jgi:hypothetical protein
MASITGNTAAQRAYEKTGFGVADERRHPEFEATVGAPRITLLCRDL